MRGIQGIRGWGLGDWGFWSMYGGLGRGASEIGVEGHHILMYYRRATLNPKPYSKPKTPIFIARRATPNPN